MSSTRRRLLIFHFCGYATEHLHTIDVICRATSIYCHRYVMYRHSSFCLFCSIFYFYLYLVSSVALLSSSVCRAFAPVPKRPFQVALAARRSPFHIHSAECQLNPTMNTFCHASPPITMITIDDKSSVHFFDYACSHTLAHTLCCIASGSYATQAQTPSS
jgi:hypothetical protein